MSDIQMSIQMFLKQNVLTTLLQIVVFITFLMEKFPNNMKF